MKRIIIAACILVALVLLVPIPMRMRDGGTVHYNALLYDVYDMHRISTEDESSVEYVDGVIIEIVGIAVFDNTKAEVASDQDGTNENAQKCFFVGKVTDINAKGFLVEVTNADGGAFFVGEPVQVNADLSKYPSYDVGDHLKITFDGKVALSYPPQVTSVFEIVRTDSNGDPIN